MKNKQLILFFFLFFYAVFSLSSEEIFNFPSGNYNDDVFVSIYDIKNTDDVSYSFIAEDQFPSIPYSGGLLLSAIPGEERKYDISIKINDKVHFLSYLIDKRYPEKPEPVFKVEQNERGYIFESRPSEDSSIFYGYDEYNKGDVFKWKGEYITPPNSGFIYYFAEDFSGNKSNTGIIKPELQKNNSYRAELKVKSPVEGVFLNTQILFIDKEGFEWIRYTLNGYDPQTSGALYSEPVEIRRYGNVSLKIAAKPLNSDSIITKEIKYQVNTQAPLKLPVSGIYSEGINIESYLTGYRYCLEDRSPDIEDPLFENKLIINPIYGGVKYSTLRISNIEDEETGDYRYFYILDDRFPASPIINCKSRLPDERFVEVEIKGPVYSDLFYSTDGTTPGKTAEIYQDKFELEIPDNKNAGSIIIKARALSLNGKTSSVVSRIFTYDTQKPEIPVVQISKSSETQLYELDYNIAEDEKLYYCLKKNTNIENISRINFSPVKKEEFFLDVPTGMKGVFDFVFAVADSAGNWSGNSEPVHVEIDKTVPAYPIVDFTDYNVTVLSTYDVNYTYKIFTNGREVFTKSDTYLEPIKIDKSFYNSTLSIELTFNDNSGRIIRFNKSFYLPGRETKKEAVLFSRKAEDIYSGEEVAFYAYPDGIDDTLFYYLTEYSVDGEKNTKGPIETDGFISIAGIENSKIDYFLEVFSVNEESGHKSIVNSYEFTIDNEKPKMPVISGIENGAIVNDRVVLLPSKSDDSSVFLNYSKNKEDIGYLFTKDSIIFNNPLVFDVKDEQEADFYLKIGAGDSAGNSIENQEIFHFKIDKKAPVISEIFIDSTDLQSNKSLDLSFKGEENIKYYYETGIKGSLINNPDLNSSFFTDTLNLDEADNTDVSKIIKIIPVDDAGNMALFPLSFMYRIDKKAPMVFSPETSINDKYKKIFTSWSETENSIFYRITDELASGNDWVEYSNPFSIKYNSNTKKVNIDYYFMDQAGNKSKIESLEISLPSSVVSELVTGVDNNSFYNENIELQRLDTNGIIRYEITTDQFLPPEVNVFSPLLPKILPFKIEDGESLSFVVSIKEYKDEEDIEGGAEQVLRFTIDKQLPEPPEIGGIKNGEYYLNDCTAFFQPSADKIYYSIQNSLEANDFIEYKNPFDIQSPDGTYYTYTVNAYTEDFSGNKSSVKSWNITIDKEIIYVSDNGRDYYEGTRSKPFQSLNKALEQVKHSRRKTIFIEEGMYQLQAPAVIDESVSLYGGFKKGNWQEKSGTSIINLNNNFADENPAFYIYGGSLTIENIILKVSSDISNSVFYVNKGNLNIRNSEINFSSINNSFLTQNYGKLYINNSSLSGVLTERPLLSNDYGLVSINNCDFDFKSKSEDAVLIDASNCSDYIINSSTLKLEGGSNITVMKYFNSSVKLRSNQILTAGSNVTATALELIDSRIEMNYSKIISSSNNRISRAVVSEDSDIKFSGNNFDLDAKTGIIGFNITGGNSYLYNNKLNLNECNDFIYLFLNNDGNHRIETNTIKIASADDIIHIRTKKTNLDFFNNTLITESGRNRTIVFKPEEHSTNRIINNIIYNTGTDAETSVLYLENGAMTSVKNNSFYNWENLTTGIEKTTDLINFDLIDGIYSGGRFSDNIIESPESTFSSLDDLHISSESKCIDSGYNLDNIISGQRDFDGELRPNPLLNRNSAYDIGADEYYQ